MTRRLPAVTATTVEWAVFVLALVVYALTRFWALERFPIYFFCDEAAGPLWAEQLLTRGFRDAHGTWLPLYFEQSAHRWLPLLSVYVHMLTVCVFGKSITVARATSAAVSLMGAAAVSLTLRWIFAARFWWVGVLLLAATPCWFLHSRTAFEPVIMVTFYAWFLLCYLLYRTRSPWYLLAAVPAGAACFYSYSNGQVVMAVVTLLLFVSDARYHFRHPRVLLCGILLGAVMLWPLINFLHTHPGAGEEHLRAIDSYVVQRLPWHEKLNRIGHAYLDGLNPQYWFFPNERDLLRHRMQGYAHIRTDMLPLVALGVGLCLWRRAPAHRVVLLSAFAPAAGAALAGIAITRVLAFVVPASILAGLGLEVLLVRLTRWIHESVLAVALVALLSGISLTMLHRALTEGPLWFRNYGLYGMQYGAQQLFAEVIPEYLNRDPAVRVRVSHLWANGSDLFIRFFLPPVEQPRVQMQTIDGYLFDKLDLKPDDVVIVTADEYKRARVDPKFRTVEVQRIVPYPDGTPGFYALHLAYADDADQIFAAEREARRRLVEEDLDIGGQKVHIRHSRLGMGQVSNLFDGDPFTLVRGLEANPFVIELSFAQPRLLSGLGATVGSMDFSLTAKVYTDPAGEPAVFTSTYRGLPPDPHVELSFLGTSTSVTKLWIEVKDARAGETAQIHIRELVLR